MFHDVTFVQPQCPHKIKMAVSFGRSPSGKAILAETAEVFGVTQQNMLADRRNRELARARWAAVGVARQITKLSFPQIGKVFNRDHTSILHAAQRAEEILSGKWEDKYDGEDFREKYQKILGAFGRV